MTVRRVLRRVFGIGALVLLALPVIAILLGLRQPRSLTLPRPTGPYAVGRLVVDWRDDNRVDPFAPPGTKRELPVWIWYPAPPQTSGAPATYMPDRWREAMQPRSPVVRFVMGRFTTDRANVTGNAFDGPPLASSDRPFPVLILKPALGAAVVQNSVLAEDLASHGYVVAGSDSPYTTPAVVYQDGRVVLRNAAGHPSENAPGRISDLAPGQPNDLYLPVLDVWVADNRFVLDRLTQLNADDPAGRFTGRLDLAAVGAFGHSLGGATALQFCHADTRCRAGVDLDGMPLGDVNRAGVGKPFLFLFADRPVFEREPDRPDAKAFLHALARLRASTGTSPNLLLVRGAEHFNFFDQALLTEPTLWRWVGAMGALDPARALHITRTYVRSFFDAHLKGTRSAILDGPSAAFGEVGFP
jgi:predicted dienelactone hydrolase